MAPEYKTPGVYIEEVSGGARPIQAVGTRTAGFVGVAPNARRKVNNAVAVNNWAEFVRCFATGDPPPAVIQQAVDDQALLDKHIKDVGDKWNELSPADKTKRTLLLDEAARSKEAAEKSLSAAAGQVFPATNLSMAVYGFFLNGGSRCYVVNIGSDDSVSTADELATTISVPAKTSNAQANSERRPISGRGGGKPVGLDVLAQIDEVAIVAAPGYTEGSHYEAIRTHCDNLKDRVGILDGPPVMDDSVMQQLSSGLLASGSANTATWTMPDTSEGGFVSLYVPWIEVSNPDAGRPLLNSSKSEPPKTIMVPPSGHIAGIWARNDATRGVHKAPANEVVRGALGLAKQITHEEQGLLNQKGVNVIRYFPNEGFLVWGARTLTNSPAFKYLNVRRLLNMIEESIAESTRWIVFEPNDRPLWKAIRRDVTAFLMGFWRDGALMGRTPEEAFYVKCDEETNPRDSINLGRVVIEVGLAPVLPAEFVIFRISQYEAGTEVELQS